MNDRYTLSDADDLQSMLLKQDKIRAQAAVGTIKLSTELARADKSASFDDFISMVNMITTKALKKYDISFSPDEGKRLRVDPSQPLAKPHIQFSIIDRVPQRMQKKPRAREEFSEIDANGAAGRKGIIYGQVFDYIIQFDVLASDYITANQVMNSFEDAMFTYTAYFKKNGVSEMFFHRQFTDINLDAYRDNVSVRSLQYAVSIEKNRPVYDTTITEMSAV